MRILPIICVLAVAAVCAATSDASPAPPADTAQAKRGAELYAKYCQLCHGGAMEGYAADNAPSLVSPTFRESAGDAFLRSAIERGRAGTAMAGYGRTVGGPLEPAEIDALISYIRGGKRAAPMPGKRSRGDAEKGRLLYATHCQSCHGSAEQRSTAVHLANPMFLETASDTFLRHAIVRGRPGTPMEPWQGKLAAQEIENVIAYVRSLARSVPPPPPVDQPSIEDVPVVINPTGPQAEFTLRQNRYVSVADVAKAYEEKRRLVLVDARTPSDYAQLRITGAISIPYFNMRDLEKIPNDGTWVITYCACPHHVSGIVMDELRKRGYPHTAVLDEGLFVWQQRGHAIVAAPGQLPMAAPPPMIVAPVEIPAAR